MDNLTIGAESWLHKSWQGSFYPEDLPEDWQLEFYSNQFYCVLVPEVEWMAWTEHFLEEMQEALEGEKFTVIFKVTKELTLKNLGWLEKIVEVLSCVSITVRLLVNSSVLPENNLPVSFDFIPITYEAELGVVCDDKKWSWSSGNKVFSGEALGVVDLLPKDSKKQVEILQSFVNSWPKDLQGAPFIVADKNVKPVQLIQLQTLAELLGF